MNQTLTEIYQSVEMNIVAAAALAVLGLAYSALRLYCRLTGGGKTPRTLFPDVKTTGAKLKGATNCSLNDGVFLREQHTESGDLSFDFPCEYVLPADPAPHRPRRRPIQHFEHHTPYYYPRKQVPKSNVHIFSPTMSPNDQQRYFEYAPDPVFELFPGQNNDTLESWAHPDYEAVGIKEETIDIPPPLMQQHHQPHMPETMHSHGQIPEMSHVPVATEFSPADTYSGQVLMPGGDAGVLDAEADPLVYPLLNDVLDVVYDSQVDDSTFAPVISHDSQSHTSSDHSDHEYLSPPYVYRGSPASPESSSSSGSPESQERFVCPHCSADFRIKGYLTRHLKKHARQKAYTCPFYDPESGHKCHPTGGFSRRDTYKTHLKARHFIYPQNTPCNKRSQVAGKCSACQQSFSSNETWVESHIQTKECLMLSK